jgi:hypothetical protein
MPHRAKKIFKFIGYIIALAAVLLLGFHLWFIYHSEKTIEDLITWASDGKLKSSIKKFKIDYVNNNIDIKELTIFNIDSSAEATSYRFSTKDFHLRIRSRWDLIFNKKLLIDSVVFNSPDIIVTRRGVRPQDTTNKKLLLAEELGNVYKAINQSLAVLNLQRFEIYDGRVLINDAHKSNRTPFRLSHIFLSIDKLNIDSTTTKDSSRFIFSDRMLLRMNDQHILLPDNKSSVDFKELLIDSKEKSIRVTSPVVRILPSKDQKNSVIISAHSLNITGLDFNALYQQELIKADSVFLENPDGNLEIFTGEKNNDASHKKKTPLDSALLHLPVAINISHVVIQHADGMMHLHQGKKITSFQTKNDNVSVVGVRINDSSGGTLNIDGFNYTARNYIGYTPDSIYRFRFDSLQFINNKIVLHHFIAATVKKTKANLIRDYIVPRFEITGMDWFSFIFDNHFKARNAVLYNPVLHIEKNILFDNNDQAQKRNKRSIYQTLSVMDSLLDLDRLKIVNGNFSFKQGDNLNLRLQHLDLIINADELTKAKSVNQIVNSVKQLSFDTATVTNAFATLSITKSDFNSKEKSLLLNNVFLNSGNGNILADLNNVALNDFSFDNNELEVNGVQWKSGIIHIAAQNKNPEKSGEQTKTPAFLLNNISGNNTSVVYKSEKIAASLFLKTINGSKLFKQNDKPFEVENLLLAGNHAKLDLPDGKIKCSEFMIMDKQRSMLQNILFEQKTSSDSILISVPSFTFIPFFNATIATNIITIDSLQIHQPKIFFSSEKNAKEKNAQEKQLHLPKFNIKTFAMDDASVQINIADRNNKIATECYLPSLDIKSIATQKNESLVANDLFFRFNDALFKKNDSITVKIDNGAVIKLNRISYYPTTQDWEAQLDQFVIDRVYYSVKKAGNKQNGLTINKLSAENIVASNTELKQPLAWLFNHSHAVIKMDFVHWQSDNADLLIKTFQFNQNKKRININSFSVDPGKNKEDFINSLVYRKDYMETSAGQIAIDGVEMHDGLLHIPDMNINDARLNVYSDKLKKAGAESTQLLPVAAIKKIPIAIQVNKIHLNNMMVNYTELNEGTRQTGRVYFDHVLGDIFNVASKPDAGADSLRINVRTKFLDTMQLHLSLNESYTEPLSGLRLQLQLGAGDARLLNPFLIPLVSMRAKSGYIDTMSMTAVGDEYVSHGNMRLYYHDLKADLLDSGDVQHHKFGTKLSNFFANVLAIRNNNSTRKADFNFVRIREKSSISYFLTMVVQGAAGSVAPLSKIIYRKEYKKKMKKSASQKGK